MCSLCSISSNGSPAAKKVEQYAVDRVTGDGRCLFRALVFVLSCSILVICNFGLLIVEFTEETVQW